LFFAVTFGRSETPRASCTDPHAVNIEASPQTTITAVVAGRRRLLGLWTNFRGEITPAPDSIALSRALYLLTLITAVDRAARGISENVDVRMSSAQDDAHDLADDR
jgi:hypothetical protein